MVILVEAQMATDLEKRIGQLEDIEAIRRLKQYYYCHCVDRAVAGDRQAIEETISRFADGMTIDFTGLPVLEGSESLFRTLKYRPEYPEKAFDDVAHARAWVELFVRWYNHEHRHSAIRFVTPHERHSGQEREILQCRHALYQEARLRHPERWSGETRNWTPAGTTVLTSYRPKIKNTEKPDVMKAA
jgi:Integrase core domain